jgi:DNA-binding NarL/FixJ family response regulator
MKTHPVDMVLMDINLPGKSGIECTSLIRDEYPEVRVLICTVFEDDDKIFRALAAGAGGYILKKSSSHQILEAMDELMLGGAPISSPVARRMVDFFQQNSKKFEPDEKLTERELEILNLLSQGHRNKEIGEKLFISIPTVKTHIYNIYRKLHVQSRIAAVNAFNSMRGFRTN